MIVLPFSPAQKTSYFWKCSTKRPVAVTLSASTRTPVSAVLTVQPTPFPWSARQAQMSSRIVLSWSTSRLLVGLPACGPPMREKQARGRSAGMRSADAEEHVLQRARVRGVSLAEAAVAQVEQHRLGDRARVE